MIDKCFSLTWKNPGFWHMCSTMCLLKCWLLYSSSSCHPLIWESKATKPQSKWFCLNCNVNEILFIVVYVSTFLFELLWIHVIYLCTWNKMLHTWTTPLQYLESKYPCSNLAFFGSSSLGLVNMRQVATSGSMLSTSSAMGLGAL